MVLFNSSFCEQAIKFARLGASFGWHERNAGNISLRLTESEIDEVRDSFDVSRPWIDLPQSVPDMANEYVFTTTTGSYFTNLDADCFCVCQIDSEGRRYRAICGGERPTSELCGHLLSLAVLKRRGDGKRAVYHCHPADIVALSYILPADDKSFTESLWRSETECAFVFPNGVGVVGFEVPGSLRLAKSTAEKLQLRDAVVWSFHGLFAVGDSIKSAFGLAHAIAKSAEIRLKVLSSGQPRLGTITDAQLKLTADTFGCELADFSEREV